MLYPQLVYEKHPLSDENLTRAPNPTHSSSNECLTFDFTGDVPKQNFFTTQVQSFPFISVCFSPPLFQIHWSHRDKTPTYIWEVRSPGLCIKVY